MRRRREHPLLLHLLGVVEHRLRRLLQRRSLLPLVISVCLLSLEMVGTGISERMSERWWWWATDVGLCHLLWTSMLPLRLMP